MAAATGKFRDFCGKKLEEMLIDAQNDADSAYENADIGTEDLVNCAIGLTSKCCALYSEAKALDFPKLAERILDSFYDHIIPLRVEAKAYIAQDGEEPFEGAMQQLDMPLGYFEVLTGAEVVAKRKKASASKQMSGGAVYSNPPDLPKFYTTHEHFKDEYSHPKMSDVSRMRGDSDQSLISSAIKTMVDDESIALQRVARGKYDFRTKGFHLVKVGKMGNRFYTSEEDTVNQIKMVLAVEGVKDEYLDSDALDIFGLVKEKLEVQDDKFLMLSLRDNLSEAIVAFYSK